MRDLIILLVHLITTVFRLAGPGGLRSVVAESVLIQASAPDRESLAWPCPKPLRVGSADRRMLFTMDKADSPCAGGHRFKTVNAATFPSGSGPAKVSAAVFAKVSSQAWAKRPQPGLNSRRCRYEAAQSDVGMSSHCRADHLGLRHS